MSAYVIVEGTVLDDEFRRRYGSQVEPILREFSKTALAWYQSPAYQSLVEIRTAALDCRFRLVNERRLAEHSHERVPLEGS
jgi:uncharacterized protein (DUF1330 family)